MITQNTVIFIVTFIFAIAYQQLINVQNIITSVNKVVSFWWLATLAMTLSTGANEAHEFLAKFREAFCIHPLVYVFS